MKTCFFQSFLKAEFQLFIVAVKITSGEITYRTSVNISTQCQHIDNEYLLLIMKIGFYLGLVKQSVGGWCHKLMAVA